MPDTRMPKLIAKQMLLEEMGFFFSWKELANDCNSVIGMEKPLHWQHSHAEIISKICEVRGEMFIDQAEARNETLMYKSLLHNVGDLNYFNDDLGIS